MGLKTLFIKVYFIISVLLFVLILLTILFFVNNDSFIKISDNRFSSLEMAEELRKSSDDLTAYCKLFVETGDTVWKVKYYNTLDIRNGKKVRSNGRKISFKDSIIKLGFSDLELEKITESENNSNLLVQTEEKAMKAAEGLYADKSGRYTIFDKPDLAFAKQLLYCENYLQSKQSILEPIDDCIVAMKARTNMEVKDSKNTNFYLLFANIIAVVVISIIIFVSFLLIYKNIVKQFKELENVKLISEQNEENFRFLFDISPDIIGISNIEGYMIETNKAGFDFHAISSKDEMKKIKIDNIYQDPNDRIEILNLLKQKGFVRNKEVKLMSHNSNKQIHGLLSAELVKTKENKEIIISWIRDIAETLETERTILKLSTAVLQNPAAIVITDLLGNIEFVNQQFTNITGYTYNEAIGQNPRVLNSGYHKKEFFTQMWDTILSGKIWKGELYNKRKDGTFFWEDATMAPILSENGTIINIVAIKQDITAKKEAEFALVDSQKQLKQLNEIKDTLFSIIGHDLRAPIGNLKSFLELLLSNDSHNDPQNQKNILKSLLASTATTFDLLENLLLWAKSQQNTILFELKKIDINYIVDNNIELLYEIAADKSISIKNNIPPLTIITADENMINTVIRNLLSNAIKFTGIGKNITFEIEKTSESFIISVIDQGIGIPPEKLKTLFDPTVKNTTVGTFGELGTGLGLILCKEFVVKHGGEIWVQSELGKGSKFEFSIPIKHNI